MTESQAMQLVGLLAILAFIGWRMSGRMWAGGIVFAAVIVLGVLAYEKLAG